MQKNAYTYGIILVSFEYPPRRLTSYSDAIFRLANYLVEKNNRVWVITFDDWRSDIMKEKKIIVNRIPNHIPDNISFFSTIMNLKTAYQSAIASVMHENNINILHLFNWQTVPLLIPWGKYITPKIIYSTDSIQSTRDSSLLHVSEGIKKLELMSLSNVDLLFTETTQLSDEIIKDYNISLNKIKVLSVKDKHFLSKTLNEYFTLVSLENKGAT